MENESDELAVFLSKAIKDICRLDLTPYTKVLDFGCGIGSLVNSLLSIGYDTYGCDIKAYWLDNSSVNTDRFETISLAPYYLPFDDNVFDVVVSTSVMEHAQDKKKCFMEIYRVLKVGGYSMHLFPGKWYLPYEPHTYVPLGNFFWPKFPRWWFALWALLGVRNEFQKNMSWTETLETNYRYFVNELSYLSNKKYRELSSQVFGNYLSPMEFYVWNSYGNFAKIFGKLPFKKLSGWLSSEIRMNFIVQKKEVL